MRLCPLNGGLWTRRREFESPPGYQSPDGNLCRSSVMVFRSSFKMATLCGLTGKWKSMSWESVPREAPPTPKPELPRNARAGGYVFLCYFRVVSWQKARFHLSRVGD